MSCMGKVKLPSKMSTRKRCLPGFGGETQSPKMFPEGAGCVQLCFGGEHGGPVFPLENSRISLNELQQTFATYKCMSGFLT